MKELISGNPVGSNVGNLAICPWSVAKQLEGTFYSFPENAPANTPAFMDAYIKDQQRQEQLIDQAIERDMEGLRKAYAWNKLSPGIQELMMQQQINKLGKGDQYPGGPFGTNGIESARAQLADREPILRKADEIRAKKGEIQYLLDYQAYRVIVPSLKKGDISREEAIALVKEIPAIVLKVIKEERVRQKTGVELSLRTMELQFLKERGGVYHKDAEKIVDLMLEQIKTLKTGTEGKADDITNPVMKYQGHSSKQQAERNSQAKEKNKKGEKRKTGEAETEEKGNYYKIDGGYVLRVEQERQQNRAGNNGPYVE